jgi:DivIVA domain-containing protein
MPASPEELESERFLVALRGYDKDEVDAFLKEVATDQRQLLQRLEKASHTAADPAADLLDDLAGAGRGHRPGCSRGGDRDPGRRRT